MYFIGIDVSKFKHDFVVIDDFGKKVAPIASFTNDQEGFSQFKLLLDSLDAEARIGLENKKTFMGALDFLNSQAAVSLMRTRSDKFEAIS